MPLYEYKCDNCGETFEALQRFSDQPLTVHTKCGGGPVTRLLSPPALQFKGTGWYVTDYGRSGSGNGNGSSKHTKSESTAPAPDSPSNSKSESTSSTTTKA